MSVSIAKDVFSLSLEFSTSLFFFSTRLKLQKLNSADNMTKEETDKVKQELEAEYLALFKKTVAVHEKFLARLAGHPLLKMDRNLHVFLEYEQDLNVRRKNAKEKLVGIINTFQRTGDEMLLNNQKDVDEYFEKQKAYLIEYHYLVSDAHQKSAKMTASHKVLAENNIRMSAGYLGLANADPVLDGFHVAVSEMFEKLRKVQSVISSDEDLKLADTLQYHVADTAAGKDLLFRRLKSLAQYEGSNRDLDRARAKNKVRR